MKLMRFFVALLVMITSCSGMHQNNDTLSYYRGPFSYKTPCEQYEILVSLADSWIKVLNHNQKVVFEHTRVSLGSGLEDIKMPLHSSGILAFKSGDKTCMLYHYKNNLTKELSTKGTITHIDLFDNDIDKLLIRCTKTTTWHDVNYLF